MSFYKTFTKEDYAAAIMRNAIFDSSTLNIMEAEDRAYETFDAKVLERCYRKIDEMTTEAVDAFVTLARAGFEAHFDRDTEGFFFTDYN